MDRKPASLYYIEVKLIKNYLNFALEEITNTAEIFRNESENLKNENWPSDISFIEVQILTTE